MKTAWLSLSVPALEKNSVKQTLFLLSFYVFIFLAPSQQAVAQWSSNPAVNNAISAAAGDQFVPKILSDGAGGAIITWYDLRSGSNYDIYAQRISASGVVQWAANGVAVCTAAGDQYYPTITGDGAGGAIITWFDYRNGDADIYAQRVNASGLVQWMADGVAISTAVNAQGDPTIVSDGGGGAIVTWEDNRNGNNNNDVYAQRVDASGMMQWTTDGVAVSTAAGDQLDPIIIADGAGGAVITWYDFRNGNSDIYAQRVNPSGAMLFMADGVAVCIEAGDQYSPVIVNGGAGGAVITWQDNRSGNADIYAQRLDALGAIQWAPNGVAVCTATNNQALPEIASDNAGGAIITWITEAAILIYMRKASLP